MIATDILEIENESDFDKLTDIIKPTHIDKEALKNIKEYLSGTTTRIVIEYPYFDKDYLSTYYLFYSKKNRNFNKACYRIHFWNHENYIGYITLRPTAATTRIGKTYLNADVFLDNNSYMMTSSYKVHLLGEEFLINAFPWMKQETDISVCGHVAMWTILRYYGNKYSNYPDITMGSIIEKMPESIGRKVPTKILNIQQIPDVFKKLDFSPIVVQKSYGEDQSFREELFAYIESGIPVIACMSQKKHAISIIGHGPLNYDNLNKLCEEHIVLNSKLIDSIIIQDDNLQPYTELKDEYYNPFYMKTKSSTIPYNFNDIDYLIVPLYQRMQFSYLSVREAIDTYLNNTNFLSADKQYIMRIYITSSNSFKKHAYYSKNMNIDLQDKIMRLVMPKFIWCVDFSTFEEYEKELISARLIFDTTCCNKELFPMILIQNDKEIIYYDNMQWFIIKTKVAPYEIYINNLKKVGGDDADDKR